MKGGSFLLLLVSGYLIWSLIDADKKGVAAISQYNFFKFVPGAATFLGLK